MMNAKELELKLSDALQREDVLKEKISALEARCAALAAESAGLKVSAIFLADEAVQVYKRWNLTQQPDGDIVDMQTIHETICACHETPATGAFLAEVRAQGVEMLTADRRSEWMDSYIDDANEFAAQIRKGVQS